MKCLGVILLAAAVMPAQSQQTPTAAELASKSLEELMNIEVTTSREKRRWS